MTVLHIQNYELTIDAVDVRLETTEKRLLLTPNEARRLAYDLMQAAADVEEIQQGQEQMA